MALQPPPAGYLNRKIAQSVQEAIQSYTTDHIKTIVKASIQKYIESFMSQQGGNRSLFETFSKQGLQYIVDKSFDPTSDPTLRKTQLARLFEQLHRELPAILIIDSGFEFMPTNINGIERAFVKDNAWYGVVTIMRKVSITVAAGTRDQTSTDFLQGMLSVLFGEMRFLGGGTRITGNIDQGEHWVVTMGNPKFGAITQDAVTDDPKDKVWSFSIENEDIYFEDHIMVKQPIDRVVGGSGVVNSDPNVPPVLICPTSIPVNQSTRIEISKFQPDFQRVIVSDPNIATYEPVSQTITPRRLGTFQLQVVANKPGNNGGAFNQQTGALYNVLTTLTVRVTPS
jgi:hypothetical protein